MPPRYEHAGRHQKAYLELSSARVRMRMTREVAKCFLLAVRFFQVWYDRSLQPPSC
jgi:hypothetical protein